MHSPDSSNEPLPVPGAPGYCFALGPDGEPRILSARSRKFLTRYRRGLHWLSKVRLPDGREKWINLNDAGAPAPEQEAADLVAKGARPLPEHPGFVMLPTTEIFRIEPASRGMSAARVREVTTHYRSGSPYVQLPAKYGRRSTYSVAKLHHKIFGPSAPAPSESPV